MYGCYFTRDTVSPQVSPAYAPNTTQQTPYQQQMPYQQQSPYQHQMPYQQQSPYQQASPNPAQLPYFANPTFAVVMLVAGPDYPSIIGYVTFMDIPGGVRVCADVSGMPPYKPATGEKSPTGPFGFHIHDKGNCTVGDPAKPFEASGGHWNPTNQPHGNHISDFPVLIPGINGRAVMCFDTDKFSVNDVLGKAVVIHENPDDYRTQPAGNSGKRIACGVIRPWNPYQQYMM